MAGRRSTVEGLVMERSFWSGKRVLLTGHTGFKGGWLALWLTELGAEVTGLALPPATDPSLFVAARIAARIDHREGDIRDLAVLRRAFQSARPDIAIHMAAQPLVRRAYAEPVYTYATNVLGTVHFLEAVREQPTVRVAVVVTSDKCYSSQAGIWGLRENDPMGGDDPYSSSKGCAELVTAAYRHSFFPIGAGKPGTAIASARAGNVVGGGDWSEDRLVPDAMRALARGAIPQIRNPDAVRPWQHVLEPLCGYLLLARRLWAEPGRFAEGWNFAPDPEDAQPVRRVVERLCGLWGVKVEWQVQPGSHPTESLALRLDSTKARALLGWRPRWRLEQALQAAVAWHREFLAGGDMQRTMLRQIAEYEHAS